jgi:hypothetical protein
MSSRKHQSNNRLRSSLARAIDALEPRRFLCINPHGNTLSEINPLGGTSHVPSLHGFNTPVVEEIPGFVPTKEVPYLSSTSESSTPANIVWTNRGITSGSSDDRFDDIFGAEAETARRVVDQVIIDFERMIGSFNYTTPSNFNLTLSMGSAGSGFGASAGLTGSLGGKPRSGSVTMGGGNTSTTDPFKGWFIDTTPEDDSEFLGTIQHAFTGQAQSGSPASGRGDFYTVVAAELTHTLGLFNTLSGWTNKTTDTGIADNAEGGGVGRFFIFEGPSITHLMTSNNGGPGGQDFNEAIHSAGPATRTIDGVTYVGQNDIGNAVYEFGVRYKPNQIFALMFRDAYGFTGQNPARFGSFYAHRNSTNGTLTVRGSNSNSFTNSTSSADAITIRVEGSELVVNVDIGTDPGGTGSLGGTGNLPAWEHRFNLADVTSIVIQSGAGNDTINLGPDITVPISIDAGSGTDVLVLESGIAGNAWSIAAGNVSGPVQATFSAVESISVIGSAADDSLSLTAGLTTPVTFSGNAGFDLVNVIGNDSANTMTLNALNLSGAVSLAHSGVERFLLDGRGAADTFNVSGAVTAVVRTGNGLDNVTVNAGSTVIFDSIEADIATLLINAGGRAEVAAGGANTLKLNVLNNSGILDLADNALIVTTTPFSSIRTFIRNGYDNGTWNGPAPSIISSVAASSAADDALGHASASDISASVFGDLPVAPADTLVRLTISGDTNLDRTVGFTDLLALARNYNLTGPWAGGDFDYDNTVGFTDLLTLARNYNLSLAPTRTASASSTNVRSGTPTSLVTPSTRTRSSRNQPDNELLA